jgi:hypothetical protein
VSIASGNSGVSISTSLITNHAQQGIQTGGTGTSPTITANTITQNLRYGIYADGGALTITSNTIATGTDDGILIVAPLSGALIANNTITTTTGSRAIEVPTIFSGALDGNTATGSGINGVVVNASDPAITSSTLWSHLTMPYVLLGQGGNNCGQLKIATGATLTIAPGVIVKVGGACFGTLTSIVINGSLIANGTTAQPIVFTSLADDQYGGDTNSDGTQTLPQAGQWTGITFQTGSAGSISRWRSRLSRRLHRVLLEPNGTSRSFLR